MTWRICMALVGLSALGSTRTPAEEPRTWQQAGFGSPEWSAIDPAGLYAGLPGTFTHELGFTMLNFRGSAWKTTQLEEQLRKMARIFARCSVRIRAIRMVTSDPLRGLLNLEGPPDPSLPDLGPAPAEILIARAIPTLDRPLVVWMKGGSRDVTAFSGVESHYGPGSPLVNTIWISGDSIGPGRPNLPLAHEFGHILLGLVGHVDAPNLMGGSTELLNETLTEGQCEAVRASPFVKRIE